MKNFETPEIRRFPIVIKDQVTGLDDNPLVNSSNDNGMDPDYFE